MLMSSVLPAVLFLAWFRQDKTVIIIILQVQFLGTQLAKNASRGVQNQFYYKSDITDNK